MKTQIKKILVISLSNIGDIILTFPVIDILKRDFPQAQIDLIIGPKGQTLVENNPIFRKIYLYHKNQSLISRLKWIKELTKNQYDLVVDLRNTLIPFLIFARHKTPLWFTRKSRLHMRQKHLARLNSVHNYSGADAEKFALSFSSADQAQVKKLLGSSFANTNFVIIAPGSRAENKRWKEDGFAQLAEYLSKEFQAKIIFIGDEYDQAIVLRIMAMMTTAALDLTGQLTLAQSGYLLSLSKLAIVNDSAVLHLASYLHVPVAAFFGPTDPANYGPWSDKHIVVRQNSHCPACLGDKNSLHNCMSAISSQEALVTLVPWFREILNGK